VQLAFIRIKAPNNKVICPVSGGQLSRVILQVTCVAAHVRGEHSHAAATTGRGSLESTSVDINILRTVVTLLFTSTLSSPYNIDKTYFSSLLNFTMTPNPDWVKALKPATDGAALLKKERAKSDIPVDKVTLFLFGEEFLETRRKILELLQSEKVFEKSENYYAGRIRRFENSLARAKRLRLLANEHDWSLEDHNIAVDLLGEPNPYMLHGTMFLV
jgi:hypothetical protein